jgi:predicted negative regulator of RcsB-dependent stress response
MLKARKRMTKKELKTDPFFEKMDTFVRFYRRNEKKIWTGIVLLIVVILSASYITRSVTRKNEKAKSQISIAQFYLKGGQQDMAIELLNELKDGLYGDKYAGFAAYYLGGIYLKNKEYDQAEENYDLFLNHKSGDNMMKATAWAGLASIAEIQQNPEEASANFFKAANLANLKSLKVQFAEKAFKNSIKAGDTKRAELILEMFEKLDLNEEQENKLQGYRNMIR